MSDAQSNIGPESAAPAGRTPGTTRGTAFKVAALVLTALCLVIGAACWFGAPRGGNEITTKSKDELPPGMLEQGLFHGWTKPDFAVVLTAQQHGYLLPCGCSEPQKGGLERRYNFVKLLQTHGWPVVAYDVGDIAQNIGPANLANVQGLIKYRYSMEALREIGYTAVSFGQYEASLALSHAIDEYALNNDRPALLAANLIDKARLFPDEGRTAPEWDRSYVGSWQVTNTPGGTKVGALGVVGTHTPADVAALVAKGQLPAAARIPPSVGDQITHADPKFKFVRAGDAMAQGVKALTATDFRVLLYQGPVELAKLIPPAAPQFNVILCLSQEDEPPAIPDVVGDTFIVRVGHKGKFIGVVGVYAKPGGGFNLRYQLVTMSPEFATKPADEKGHPIIKLMEDYTRELKAEDYMSKYGKVPHPTQASLKAVPGFANAKSGYAGSEACMKCHAHAYKVWAASDHAHAYKTLVDAKKPSLRQFDAECIVCHTVGFRYQDGFVDAAATPKLMNVGCESCHGPCEAHKNNPNNPVIHALINPWKAPPGEKPAEKAKRMLRIGGAGGLCMGCHDPENDVHWTFDKWEKKNIIHMTPPVE
jgi:hypothetical protein